ncbi:MAG: IS110 family transposase [Ginsengibacter sp.]
MNEFKIFAGIDISKKTFDVAVLSADIPATIKHACFQQNLKGFHQFVDWITADNIRVSEVLFCMEHTGLFINGLVEFLLSVHANLWIEMPLRIKRTIGLQRGGDDKVAAINIAQFAYRYRDTATLWKPLDTAIEQLRNLVAQRDRLILAFNQLSVPVNELEACGSFQQTRDLKRIQKFAITGIEKSLKAVEARIDEMVAADKHITKAIQQVTSVKGVGKQTAIALYVYTKGFSTFENAKQLACYCGVVPFTKSSGTSVRYKSQVSPFANKKLKKLLHLCAMSALRFDKGLSEYYKRKTAEGKNKMSVINAIRNKLLLRIFAVVRDDRNYVESYIRPCA